MPVFKNVGLNSAPLAHAVVVEFAETLLSAVVGPIVRREDDEHILCQVQQTECIQRKADVVIDLKDKFAIGPGFVFAYEGALGNDRTIWTGWIPVDEESVFPNQWRKHRCTSFPLKPRDTPLPFSCCQGASEEVH